MTYKKYIMYLRKSAMDSDFEASTVEETLKRHKKILTDYAKSKKLHVDIILEEVVSGESLSARPQMMKCLELVNTGEYAGVICMDIDRLSRGNSMDSGYITQVLQINNCQIITPAKTYDLANESDEQFTDMKFMFSRYELKTITKRMHRGRDASALEGKYIGSVPPFGYERYKLQGTKGYSLKINPTQAEIVRLVYELYNTGIGYDRVINEIKNLGIQPTYPIKVWDKHTVQNIIKNPVYIGKIRYKHKPQQKVMIDGKIVKKRALNKDGDIIVDGLHEPIISEELWNRTRELQKRKLPVQVNRELQNPFAKVVICGKCGRVMTRKIVLNKNRYRIDCPAIGCDTRSMYFDEFEEIVLSEMKKWFESYKITISKDSLPEDNTLKQTLDSICSQLANLEEQQNKICELLEKGVYTIEVFTKRNEKLQIDIDALKNSKRNIESELNKPKIKADITPSIQSLLDSYDILSVKQKNDIWQEIMEKIEYIAEPDDKELHLKFYPRL